MIETSSDPIGPWCHFVIREVAKNHRWSWAQTAFEIEVVCSRRYETLLDVPDADLLALLIALEIPGPCGYSMAPFDEEPGSLPCKRCRSETIRRDHDGSPLCFLEGGIVQSSSETVSSALVGIAG